VKLLKIDRVRDGKYLKSYELTYENREGREKKFEMVSHSRISTPEELGQHLSGMSIVVRRGDTLLLLREFRMAVNRPIYNLCAGMIEQGEAIEEAIRRELYEETGLYLKSIIKVLRPAFAAVGMSDIKNCIAFVEAEGELADHTSPNEEIQRAFYSREEVEQLLETEDFSSRAQIVAYMFTRGAI
jgi:ADP-ribose pyrophosphatase